MKIYGIRKEKRHKSYVFEVNSLWGMCKVTRLDKLRIEKVRRTNGGGGRMSDRVD